MPTTVENKPAGERPNVATLRARPDVDVLIIGGGINGLGVLRELAMQGIDVALVERGDYCSGASAASSHMIHGGVRYLENGEFRLVRESVGERNGLLRVAPHFVKPLRTTIPIFTTLSGIVAAPLRFLTHHEGSKHVERGAALIKAGLTMYDAFSRDGGSLPRHRFLRKARALDDLPELNHDVKYTATYFDASVHDPERLALDVLRDALAQGDHVRAVNYVEAVGRDGSSITLRDRETDVEFTVRPKVVINTSGPWTDLTNASLRADTALMGGTKGSHIVLQNEALLAATRGREIFFEHRDGRIVLIYPLKGRVLVGTTDIETDAREAPVCTDAEVDYFFDLIRYVFPHVALDPAQIVYTFSGIRPLPKHDDLQPGFVSRDYRLVRDDLPGDAGALALFSLVGGKWTTFRALAQHVSSEVLAVLGRASTRSTAALPIGGGVGYPAGDDERRVWRARFSDELDSARVEQLLERYGTIAEQIIPELEGGDDRQLGAVDGYSAREIAYLARTEHVVHLIDLLLRRTALAFTGSLSTVALRELAGVAGDELGWDASRQADEVGRAAAELRERHRVLLDDDGASFAPEPMLASATR